MKRIRIIIMSFALLTMLSCDEGKLNFFSVDQDIEFGMQLDEMIMSDPTTYPVLSRAQHAAAYQHLDRIVNSLKQSDDLRYAQRFTWEVRIIDQDILNAFAAPGGYMYFYTGLIKFLDNEAQFAGVVAHEMAHADRRHSTQMLTKQYGFSVLAGILLGENPSFLEQIIAELAMGLGNLKYSRNNEYEADEYAVKYLYDTDYHPKELAGFFIKMNEQVTSSYSPEFLSTHPDPGNRIQAINSVWEKLGSKNGELYVSRYNDFKNSLP
jgi:beta-barrel assembly-enhancing protease